MTHEIHSFADENGLPDLPQAITSFGAAILENQLYVHGGHHGTAHHYSKAGQSDKFWRLNLAEPSAWQEVETSQRLQGHALISHGGLLYRVGGFVARNPEGEEQDLWSVADFARFDPLTGIWEDLPPLPTARSSFDATLLGDLLYVVGGWELHGTADSEWPETAYVVDLSQTTLNWQQIPPPPFRRRALSLGALGDAVYVLGGMDQSGKVTSETRIFTPSTRIWSEGPALPEGEMEGFGTDCCLLGERLYVSTISGQLLRLSEDGSRWELIETIPEQRFFHRMLPLNDSTLMLIGGASMRAGKFSSIRLVSTTGK